MLIVQQILFEQVEHKIMRMGYNSKIGCTTLELLLRLMKTESKEIEVINAHNFRPEVKGRRLFILDIQE